MNVEDDHTTTIDGDPVRHVRPPLRARLATLDARLGLPGVPRVLATVTVALLVVQGVVLLDRVEGGSSDAPGLAAADRAEPLAPFASGDPSAPLASAATAAAVGDVTRSDEAASDVAADGTSASAGDTAASAGDTAASADAGADAGAPAAAPAAASTTTRREAAPPPSSSVAPQRSSASSPQAQQAADPARQRFESLFPAQSGAGQSTQHPATTRWAVLIGVNEHSGRTRDNIGSRQDAEDLARHLRSLGWREDHIVLLTDARANRENIVQALRWLQRKANGDSVVVVHYSGHVKQWLGRDADGDREVPDEALWPSDNRFITDREVGDLLGRIRAGRMWFNVGGCEAAGFNDWGTTGPNRIVTWSSAEHQKSYEEPSVRNSVWGWQLIEQGFIAGRADANRDGNVTVEEAFRFATPRAHQRTRGQSHGPQTPEVSDRFRGEFDLRIPPPPRPKQERSAPQDEEDDRDGSCLLCAGTAAAAVRYH